MILITSTWLAEQDYPDGVNSIFSRPVLGNPATFCTRVQSATKTMSDVNEGSSERWNIFVFLYFFYSPTSCW